MASETLPQGGANSAGPCWSACGKGFLAHAYVPPTGSVPSETSVALIRCCWPSAHSTLRRVVGRELHRRALEDGLGQLLAERVQPVLT